ncbi:MAG: FG-GAP-like repeat-containing protein [Steroidobacteraceae bacterium]
MPLARRTAYRAVSTTCALLAAILGSACGGSPPHAAPANPVAEAADGRVELSWNAVTGARNYVILWSDGTDPSAGLSNEIKDITTTTYSHTGLVNFRSYSYRIAAETGGGRGPESILVRAEPGPVPGPVEWATVVSGDPGHTIHFATADRATEYRVYFSTSSGALLGRRPLAPFEPVPPEPPLVASPHLRATVPVNTPLLYRVIGMNGTRIGIDGPVVMTAAHAVSSFDLTRLGLAFGDPNADGCLDMINAGGGIAGTACTGTFNARVLPEAGLSDLVAAGRTHGDSRFADFTGDGRDDIFSSTFSPASDTASRAVFSVNQGTGNYQTDAGVTALGIGGFGGTLLAADFDNDGDVDLFAPHDHMRGDGARNWLLINNGAGVLTVAAADAVVDTNPAGADYVPRGGQAVDFNEDGRVDLLFGSRLLINNGDGTFSDGSGAAGIPVRADQGLKLADVDLDGDLDLVHHDGAVTRLHRNSAGVFGIGTVINEDTTQATFGFGLNVCDVNGDGFDDVLVAKNVTATGTGVPKLLINVDGELMASALPDELVAGSGDLIAHNDLIACGDVDSNGIIDIVSRWGQTYRLLRAGLTLSTHIRIRVLGSGNERNQQGRIVRIVPRSAPNRIMTRVIESGSGLQSQNQYDLLVGAPWLGTYDVSVRFADGVVNATAEPGRAITIFEDGRVEAGLQ